MVWVILHTVLDKNQEKAMITDIKYNFEVGIYEMSVSCTTTYCGFPFGKKKLQIKQVTLVRLKGIRQNINRDGHRSTTNLQVLLL